MLGICKTYGKQFQKEKNPISYTSLPEYVARGPVLRYCSVVKKEQIYIFYVRANGPIKEHFKNQVNLKDKFFLTYLKYFVED